MTFNSQLSQTATILKFRNLFSEILYWMSKAYQYFITKLSKIRRKLLKIGLFCNILNSLKNAVESFFKTVESPSTQR